MRVRCHTQEPCRLWDGRRQDRPATFAEADMIPKRQVPCNLCGSERFAILYPDELGDVAPSVDYNFSPQTRKTFQIVRCDSCGLIFTNPMPSLESVYEETRDETYLRSRAQRLRTAEHVVEQIRRFRPDGTLLDIGCATGILLDAASRHFAVEGIELSRWAREEAARRHKVYDQPLGALKLDKQYDVVTLMGVIEHFEDPTREILAINRALRPGGLFVLYTGDADAWLPRLLGKKWWWYQGMHLFYFSRRTCSALLDKCGFDTHLVATHRTYFQLFSLAVSLRRYWIGTALEPVMRLPGLRNVMIPLQLSGEMLMFAQKRSARQ
jgi:SAM-dependent methyltransferase